jgi:uncharacterized protein (DUF58 family)
VIFTSRFLCLLSLGAIPLLLSAVFPVLFIATLVANALLILIAIGDFLLTPKAEKALQAHRESDDILSVLVHNTVAVQVRNKSVRTLKFLVRDEPPGDFAIAPATPQQCTMQLESGRGQGFTYDITPPARGDYQFGDIYFRIWGPLGLTQRGGKIIAAAPIAVYPNVRAVGEYELLLRKAQLTRTGTRRARVGGGGREFSSLRDYTSGDEYRTIDWKATARRNRVTSRTYEAERSQDILLLLDTGRLMRQEVAYAQKLDHVINAALLLSHVISEADDRIGVLTFSDTPGEWLSPRRGRAQVASILRHLYAVRAEVVETDFREAFQYLAGHWRKRSLAILFTDIADPESSEMLLKEIMHLARGHLVCVVLVRDPLVSERVRQEPTEPVHAYEKVVAIETLAERQKARLLLENRGILVVDAEPQELSVELVAKYLTVKRRAML